LQVCDLGPDIGYMGDSKTSGFRAGILPIGCCQPKQPANVVESEAKLPGTTYKAYSGDVVAVVAAEPAALFSACLREQADPLVIPDRLDIAPCSPG